MRSTLMWIAKWFMRLPDKAVMVTVCSDFQWLNTENKVNHGKCVILLEYFICRWFKICLTEIFSNGPIQKLQQLSIRRESKCWIWSMVERNVATKVKEMQFHGKQQKYLFNFCLTFPSSNHMQNFREMNTLVSSLINLDAQIRLNSWFLKRSRS